MKNKAITILAAILFLVTNRFDGQKLINTVGNKEIIIEFNVPSLNFLKAKGINAVVPTIPKGSPIQEKGAPDLQKMTATIIIPDADKMEVKVINAEYKDYNNIEIAPSKGIIMRNQDPDAIPYVYGAAYSRDAFYPGKLAELQKPFIQRNVRGQAVWVYPLQYNPVTKTLRVYTKLVVRVYSTGQRDTRNVLTASMKEKLTTPGFAQIIKKTFINATSAKYTPVEEGHPGRMLIIYYDSFYNQILPFINWKQQKGITVDAVPVSSIGNDATSITNYVADYYNNHNDFTYLLLVGDDPQVKSSYSSNAYGASDNMYGYLAGNDHRIDIFVGRFSAETEEEVATEVEKTIYYERDIHSDALWLNYGLGIASNEGSGGQGDDGESDAQHMDNIKTDLENYGYTVNSVYQDYGTATDITNYINAGLGIINYVGHGDVTMWYSVDPNGYTNDMVNALTNSYQLPFIWTVACVVGDFTTNTCFAEAWIRATDTSGNPTGAVANIGSTINQSWAAPMDAQDEMVDILVETYPNNLKRTFGGLIANGWGHMIDEYGSDGENMADTWTCFGDPSLMVRTKAPDTMLVTHADSIMQGSTQFAVNCNVEGALISITHQNNILGTGYITNGSVNIAFSSPIVFDDSMLVTATAYNKVTYQKYVYVKISSDPPIAGFTANQTTITEGDFIQFTDTSLNYPISWSWTFEGATTLHSTQQNPNVQYLTAGTYDVKLVVSNPNGTDSVLKVDYITVQPNTNPPVADFEADPTTIVVGNTVNFTDLSTNLPDSWYWEFEGGNPATSTDQNPSVVYNTAGTYTVSLIASNAFGSDTMVKTAYITVTPPDYCYASASTEYEYISNVTIGSEVNNSSSWTGYGDYTSQVVHTHRGDPVNVTVTIGDVYNTDVLYAWVDWNLDGDFDDTGENVYANNSSQNSYSFTINVPSDAAIGNLRLRIRLNDAGQNANTDPCGTTSYGEVEDYTIAVADGITELNEPKTETIKIYPNPVRSTLYVNIESSDYNRIILYDISGKEVLSEKTHKGINRINVSHLEKGVYVLKVSGGQSAPIRKIIKN